MTQAPSSECDVEGYRLDPERDVHYFRLCLNDKAQDGWDVVSMTPDRYIDVPSDGGERETRLTRVMVSFRAE